MTRPHSRRKAKGKTPAEPPIRDPGPVRAMDSEDQMGTYAPADSSADTGENDEGMFAQGPLKQPPPKAKRRKEATR